MSPDQKPRPLFTLRTTELAGRSQEIQKLQTVLEQLQHSGNQTLFFYIAGDGGMGKTRLLEWVRDRVRTTYAHNANYFCTDILDFYNSILRTDLDLVDRIYDSIKQALPENLQANFQDYLDLRERFRRQESDTSGGGTRNQVIDAFVKAWNPLATQGYRLVVLLDTAELLRFEDDPVRKRFGALMPVASAKSWLYDMIKYEPQDETLPGVLFVLAGRKREAPGLFAEFCAWARNGLAEGSDPEQRVIQLGGLTRAGVDEYFEKLAQELRKVDCEEQAVQLLDPDLISEETRAAFYELTGGTPITLAIALQLFIAGDSVVLPDLLNSSSSALANNREQFARLLRIELARALAEHRVFGDLSLAIRYMPLARKGLTPARLTYLLQRLQPRQPLVDFGPMFAELAQQIFVKRLPDDSLVLHDVVRDWAEEGLYGSDQARMQEVYQFLAETYQPEIIKLNAVIDQLIPLSDPAAGIEDEEEEAPATGLARPRDPWLDKRTEELQANRRTRRNRVIEQMHYTLRYDPVRGYIIYFELAEEAFNVERMDYEAQIRAEFLGWLLAEGEDGFHYRPQALHGDLTAEQLDADFAVRAAQRTYVSEESSLRPVERAQKTVALVDQILAATEQKQFYISERVRILLAVYADMARGVLASTDSDVTQVRIAFGEHINTLRRLWREHRDGEPREIGRSGSIATGDKQPSLLDLLYQNALGFAYYELGFFESNQGNHGEAIKNYSRSFPLYRDIGFDMNQARSLNDRAYSSAMVGDSHAAEPAVQDALRLRKRLGFSYPIALSYNTLGIVQMLSERPVSALKNCGYALRTFRALDNRYGQMLAYRALSEASRRDTYRLLDNRERHLAKLQQAIAYSDAAVEIAADLLTDKDANLAYILIEQGCAYRDLAKFYRLYSDSPANAEWSASDADSADADSEEILKRAIKIAKNIPGARNHLVDAMIDLATLYFARYVQGSSEPEVIFARVFTKVEDTLDATLKEIPPPYQDLTHADHEKLSRDPTVYWAHLSKLHGLWVTIEQERLRPHLHQFPVTPERQVIEDRLLRHAILTLYFSSLLHANVLNVRRSTQLVYDALKPLRMPALLRFNELSPTLEEELGVPISRRPVMRRFLENQFGIAD